MALVVLVSCGSLQASTGLSYNVPDAGRPSRPTPAHFRIVVVDGLSLQGLKALAPDAALGLVVPGEGASTSRRYALESLMHGLDLNAAVQIAHLGRPLVPVSQRADVPSAPNTIVLALPSSTRLEVNDKRYPVAVIGGGFHGLLTSATTRIPGLISIADVAPTALGRTHGALGHVSSPDALGQLAQLNARIHSNNRIKLPALLIIAGALLLLGVVRPMASVPSVLAALLTSLVAGGANVSNEVLLIAMVVVGTTLGGIAIGRVCTSDRRLLAAIVAVLLTYAILMAVRPEWIAISPLGPTQNSRFWGIGNQVETLLLAPVVLGASLAARRFGLIGFAAFAIFVLVFVTDNRLGSDGGGAIVFGVALAFVGARARRLGARGFAMLLGIAAAIVLVVIQINLESPGPDHLRSAFSNGLTGVVAVFADRIPLAYVPATRQWPLMCVVATLFVILVVLALRKADRHARELVLAASLALATSLVANDSALYEVTAGVAVVAALARFTMPAAPLNLAAARSRLVAQVVTTEE